MKKKIFAALAAVTALFVLCSCGKIESISLKNSAILLGAPGETYSLKDEIDVVGSASAKIKYTSSDSSVAEVDSEGVITARAEGSAVIPVAAEKDASVKADADVLVIPYRTSYEASKYIDAMGCDVRVKITLKENGEYEYYRYPMNVAIEGAGEMPGLDDKGTYSVSGSEFVFNGEYLGEFSLTYKLENGTGSLNGSVPTGGAKTTMQLMAEE